MAFAHGRGHVALEELPLARLDDREPDAPDPAAQQVHAEQPRNEEIDVARSGRGGALIAHCNQIPPAARALQHVVHLEARQPALGARRVVAVDDGVARNREQRDPARPQPESRGRRIEHGGDEPRRRIERRRQRAVAGPTCDADLQPAGARVPEGESQREREHDRKPEDPEHRLRLAIELAHARERQLVHRMLTYHGVAVR